MAKAILILMTVCALVTTGCADSGDDARSDSDPALSGLLETAAEEAQAAAAEAALPQPDPEKPLSSYQQLDSGEQLMFHYAASSALPPNYEELAQAYSREYRNTTDTFRKRDLLEALRPRLELEIQRAGSEPYAWMEVDDARLGAYDFQRQGFPVGEFDGKQVRYFTDASRYKLTWVNHDKLRFAPVADEASARALESMRNDWGNKPRMRVYFLSQSADLNEPTVKALVTRVQLTSRNGEVLAEYSPER